MTVSHVNRNRLLVVQVAALGHDLVSDHAELLAPLNLDFQRLGTVFPAVTCTAQASFRTGLPPGDHGVVCNGFYDRSLCKTEFWCQSAHAVGGRRIWEQWRSAGRTVGLMFWQQSLGESVDLVLSPAPIHKHHGGMIQNCHTRPNGLYKELCTRIGRKFNLMRYWGPLASHESSRWISQAAQAVIQGPQAPDLLLTYLPHLDYALQKYGPAKTDRVRDAVQALVAELLELLETAREHGYHILVWGDYAITQAERVLFPNRILQAAGHFRTRTVKGRSYADLWHSRAFAMVDHQIAHIYVRNPKDLAPVRACLQDVEGIERVFPHERLNHPNAGDLIAVAAPGAWFAYPWWNQKSQAPDYASHVDIHSKPGFDPCELFWGWPPPSTGQNAHKIRGTHGRVDRDAAFATDLSLPEPPADLVTLGALLQQWLTQNA